MLSTTLSSIDVFCPLPSDEILSNYIYCLNGKMHQSPFPTFDFHVSSPLELVHSDVWSPTPVTSTNDFCVLCSLCWCLFQIHMALSLKTQVWCSGCFKYFKATVENQLNSKIKILRTDNGGEFTFNAFKLFCSSHGIIHQFSCPHTPQQNGVAERKHGHVVEYALTMLSHSKLP